MRRDYLFLGIILLLSFFLKVYGINHGLPHHFDYDESLIVESAMRTGLGDLTPPHSGWPASLHKYILFFIYGMYFLLGKLSGMFTSVDDFSTYFLLEPSSFYLIARLGSVFSGLIVIIVLFFICNKLYNNRVALLSCLLLSSTLIFIDLCHSAKQDVTMVSFLLLSFLSLSLILKTGLRKYYIFAGIFAALAISEKYNAGFVIIPVIVSHYIWGSVNNISKRMLILNTNLLIAFFTLGITFIVCNPYVIINPGEIWNGISNLLFNYSTIARVGIQQSSVNPYIYLVTNILSNGYGIIIESVVLLGLIYCIFRRQKEDVLLLSFIIPYMLFAGAMKTMAPHHLLPAIVLMIIPGSLLIFSCIIKVFKQERSQNFAFIVIPIFLVINPLYSIIKYDHLLSQTDTREVAKGWIEENIDIGSTIAIEDGTYSPALVRSQDNLKRKLLNARPDGGGKAIEILLKIPYDNYPENSYDLIGIWKPNEGFFIGKWDRRAEDVLNDLLLKGVEYIIINSYSYDRYFSLETLNNLYEETEPRRKFYQLLEKNYKITKKFMPNDKDRPGPIIKIFQIKHG
jgi:hypothetical protein